MGLITNLKGATGAAGAAGSSGATVVNELPASPSAGSIYYLDGAPSDAYIVGKNSSEQTTFLSLQAGRPDITAGTVSRSRVWHDTFKYGGISALGTTSEGDTWTASQGVYGNVLAGRIHCTTLASSRAQLLSPYTPIDADYDVSADFTIITAAGIPSIMLRGNSTSGGNGYRAVYTASTGLLSIHKLVNGTSTLLQGQGTSLGLAVGTTFNVRLRAVGTTISLFLNGQVTALLSATDATVTAKGQAGLFDTVAVTDTTGVHIDNFRISD